jgi:Flp pilus assembly pilin Flp
MDLAPAVEKAATIEDLAPSVGINRSPAGGCDVRLNGFGLSNGDNANFGKKIRSGGHGQMEKLTRLFVKVREYQRGQTMTEYALILAAVAVVVYLGYKTMGSNITTVLSSVDSQL